MRIDFVITELFVGGAERCLTQLAVGLKASGDDVRVFSIADLPTGEQSLLVDQLRAAGIPIKSGHANRSSQFLRGYRRLVAWLADSPPDVCQTFLFHANVLGSFAAKSVGVPVRVGGLRVAESRRLRCWIESAAVKRMSSLVCVSSAVQKFAVGRLRCAPERSLVIHNSVDVERFASAQPLAWSTLGWPDDSQVILFVGRLHPQKGIELIQSQIDALAPANSKRKMLLVGEGPLRAELQSWADTIGKRRVQILPWQKDVAPLLKACRLLLLPSHYEGMPNVVLEAMAAGKPVVCSKVEGSSELLSHATEKQGFLRGDAVQMKSLVESFLSDERLCNEIGQRNLARVQQDFSISAMVSAYRNHYQSLRD